MGSHQQEVAILMFLSIGMLQAQPALTILNGVSNVACGTRTQITCNVTSNSFSVMYWYANGNELAQCIITQCAASALPSNYKLSNTGQTFYLEIDPVKISDNITIECSDGQPSNAITLSPRTIISNGTLTSSKHVVGTNVEITTETNCVLNANDVTFVLTKKKSTEQHFVPDNKHTPTKSIKPCTNIDNPNCGGTKSSRVIIMTEFKNDSSGNSYTFMLKVTQYGADSWIPLGTYTIAAAHSTPPQNSSSWCDEDLNQCVTVCVVTGGLCCTVIVAVVIIFTKGNTFIVRFENIPTSVDIAKVFQSGGLSITKSESDNNYSRHSSETVSRNCVVSTKNLIKKLPSTIQVGRITLKLSYVPGRKPFEYIYSVTEGSFEQSELSSPQNRTGSRPLPMPSNKNFLPPIGHKMESVNN